MKNVSFLLLGLFSIPTWSMSEDYICENWRYRAEITLDNRSTHMWFYVDNDLVFQNYVGSIEKLGQSTRFHFYYSHGGPVSITVGNKDLEIKPTKLTALFEGQSIGWYLYDRLTCVRR